MLAETVNGSYRNELVPTRRWDDGVEVEIKANALEQNLGDFNLIGIRGTSGPGRQTRDMSTHMMWCAADVVCSAIV